MTNDEKLLLANETFAAFNYLDMGIELLSDFIESYIESSDAKSNLLFELQNRPQRAEAKAFNLLNTFSMAKKELETLQ